MRVTVLGLGVMGSGMAGRLLAAGHEVTVWNRTPEKAARLVEGGARLASSPRQAAQDADAIIAMVADDTASRTTWTGDSGALAGAKPGNVVIESSTLTTAWITELAGLARAAGCEFLDAPVTGSRSHAENGELLFLVGGDAATLERVRPVLKAMSRDVVHVGPVASGARLKLVNNFLCAVQAASLGEAMALMESSGLNLETALPVLLNGAPGSPLFKALTPRMTTRDYAVNFILSLMKKDLTYAIAEGKEHGLTLTSAFTARDLFSRAEANGWGGADFSAVVEAARTV
jgi:3-hydroxyisobutyrate dehydrogenase